MTLEEFVAQGWKDHGDDAAGVWQSLPQGIALADTPQRIFALANLATHVSGEHLGLWDDGIAFLDRLAALDAIAGGTLEGKGLRRLQAVLDYCADRKESAEARLAVAQPGGSIRPESTRIRMLAVAASALAQHGRVAEAAAAFDEALALADGYGPGADDPAARDLAVTGNNLSCALEELPSLDDARTALMLRAAETGRRFWEIAGGWMQVERAEYRLALSHLRAGLASEGLRHAQECLRIVEANGSDPGELFFAREAMARAQLALGDPRAAREERDAAAAALPRVEDEGFRAFCSEELKKLDAMLADGSAARVG
ncbi:MAG: hypothetical protein ACE15D_16660 [Candidatus Eisenbacteria bacterium]